MGSLKDALEKAGFQQTKRENERPKKKKKKEVKGIEKHQEHRNFCDVCSSVCPDVEQYKHRNPTVDAQWICIRCADMHSIPDSTRVTSQSECSKKRMFKREFV